MFEKYTEKARRTIFFARYEAGQSGSPLIETKHILLGLIREDKPLLRVVFNLDTIELIELILRRENPQNTIVFSHDIPLSEQSLDVLKIAESIRKRDNQKALNTEHLFLAFLESNELTIKKALDECDITIDSIMKGLEESPEQSDIVKYTELGRVFLLDHLQSELEGILRLLNNRKIGKIEWEESFGEKIVRLRNGLI